MSDLSRFVEDACAWLEGAETTALSTSVETLSTAENSQVSNKKDSFHNFQCFHIENRVPTDRSSSKSEKAAFAGVKSRASGFYENGVETAERVERAERAGETPAESTSTLFPLSLVEMERVEREVDVGGRFSPDPNTAPPTAEPLPIAPSDVRAGVERELRALAEDGREGLGALRDAVEITRAKIRNSEALAERQAHGGRCHLCDGPLDDALPVVAVLSGKRGSPLFLHAGCCPAYTARRIALVNRIMALAGYGSAQIDGETA